MKLKRGKIYFEHGFNRFADDYTPYYYKIVKKVPKGFLIETVTGCRLRIDGKMPNLKPVTKGHLQAVKKENKNMYEFLQNWKRKKLNKVI